MQKFDELIDDLERLVQSSYINPHVELSGRGILGLDFDLYEDSDADRAGDRCWRHGAWHAEGPLVPGPSHELLIKRKEGGDTHGLGLATRPIPDHRVLSAKGADLPCPMCDVRRTPGALRPLPSEIVISTNQFRVRD